MLQLRVNFCYVFQVNSSYDQGSWLPEEEFEMSESFPVAKVKFNNFNDSMKKEMWLWFRLMYHCSEKASRDFLRLLGESERKFTHLMDCEIKSI